ncbi:MAG: methyltransferase domain-containing protein, partial [Afipia sp.]|nr:methyltransferase domain-containing protein [Afipia sp.]
MNSLRPSACPISGEANARLVFSYDAPPQGEIGFPRPGGEPYRREVWQFENSKHYVSRHAMNVATDYSGDYVNATYGDDAGMRAAFARVIALPPERSDNAGRIARIQSFAVTHFPAGKNIRLLDVGAGLGVFPHVVKKAGWHCTAIDPDSRAVAHMRDHVGVEAVTGDFMKIDGLGQFDIVTFNKVLEHCDGLVDMLKHLVEGDDVELPKTVDLHKVPGHSLNAHMI